MADPVMDQSSMQQPLIAVDNLSKHFAVRQGLLVTRVIGEVRAVDGVSFTINAGETLALVGESGCGKSTTSRMLLKLETPTSGTISIDGHDITALEGDELKRFRSSVQAVFQDPWSSLNPRMRVRNIIAEALLAGHQLDKAQIQARVLEVMQQVGLNPAMADRYPHEFSGGQRQRIALAAALAPSPRLIVLDEPVSALDVSIGAQVMNLLKDIQQEAGVAYLMIAHNLATVRYMAHDTAVMYLGQIVEYSETEEIFDNPLHPYTKALFSASLTAHPDNRREEIVLTGEVPSPLNPPAGCRFHTRCPFVMDKCRSVPPMLADQGSGHKVACHLYPQS
ncbi:MAG TPA: dipeptide ABC transporter ATP-binding protein [Devosiaceae bacterium]|jgi:oligopeptide/dipeptide ABC transporter ATP-binding protein